MEYLSISQLAEKWGILRRIQVLCSENRIEGVNRIGFACAIPIDAKKLMMEEYGVTSIERNKK